MAVLGLFDVLEQLFELNGILEGDAQYPPAGPRLLDPHRQAQSARQFGLELTARF